MQAYQNIRYNERTSNIQIFVIQYSLRFTQFFTLDLDTEIKKNYKLMKKIRKISKLMRPINIQCIKRVQWSKVVVVVEFYNIKFYYF